MEGPIDENERQDERGGQPPAQDGGAEQPRTHVRGYVPPPSVPGRGSEPAAWPPAPPPAPRRDAGPPSLHGTPPEPAQPALPPDRSWGWRQSLAGLAVAFAPEVLIYLAAAGMGGGSTTTTTRVTAGSALALIVTSFITYGWNIFAAWLFSLRRSLTGLRAWGFRRPGAAIFWTVPTALLCVYAVSYLHDIVVHPKQQQIVSEFPHTLAGFALFFVLAVVMAPFFEEMFFRGFLFKGFANSWGWFWGALASAALFSLAHLQLDIFVPIFALGFALAWVYHRTGSLWANITLHALFNAISTIAWYYTK